MTNEKPIIFSGPMVKAILEGRKTMTRRVARLTAAGHVKEPGGNRRWHPADQEAALAAPHPVGSIMWVRETWCPCHCSRVECRDCLSQICYRATHEGPEPTHWRPSIFMPRWASRINLEVTAVKVERVQEISEEDARAEGITDGGCLNCGEHEPCGCPDPRPDARDSFCYLWDSINAKRGYGWDANPWVWAYTFRRIK